MHKPLPLAARRMIVAVLALLLTGLLVLLYVVDPSRETFLPCPTYTLLHLYCPGCGAARAMHSLLHGQLYQAFRFNAALVLLLPFLSAYGVAWASDFVRGKPIRIHQQLPQPLLIGILAALLVYGVLRNLIAPLAPAAL